MWLKLLIVGFYLFYMAQASGQTGNDFDKHYCKEEYSKNYEIKHNKEKISLKNKAIEISGADKVVCIEDIGGDGIIEVWIVSTEGEAVMLSLFQIENSRIEKIFEVETSYPVFSVIKKLDMDGDNIPELLVERNTNTEWGTLNEAGKVTWVDIYKLKPKATLANHEFVMVFKNKKNEIEMYLKSLNDELKNLHTQTAKTSDENMSYYYDIKTKNIESLISIYESWIVKINEIEKSKQQNVK